MVRVSLILLVLGAPLLAQSAAVQVPPEQGVSVSADPLVPLTPGSQDTARVCNPRALPGVIWWGTDRHMTVDRLVRYAAPIYWFSPDEPSLDGAEGAAIRHPEPFTFEGASDHPVVYYQLTDLFVRGAEDEASAFERNSGDIGASRIDLRSTVGLELSYYAYTTTEAGLGAHPHDIEPATFRMAVGRGTDVRATVGDCPDDLYLIMIKRSTGKAHGLIWFWNVLDTDYSTVFPMHLLVEEGKHALATDNNGDGVFTPGYDVNIRINDAWGVRDIIRTGLVFGGGYENWMTKVRRPEHRVLPPLPDDSPLRQGMERRRKGLPLAVYELRPFPASERAGDDHTLVHLMESHEAADWPELGRINDVKQFGSFVEEGAAVKSLSISLYEDGDLGFSIVFPFFVIAHLNDPMTGGYLVHRMYFKDQNLRDWGWMITYMPSASRWIDTYIGGGYEAEAVDNADGSTSRSRDFVMETGVKFRVNIAHSPLKFLPFTDYWGFRAGIKNRGFWSIDRLTYVLEFGAGSF